MPRQARSQAVVSNVLHIITRGNNKQKVFYSISDYEYYLFLLKEAKREFRFIIHHYALMPNHVHLLISVENIEEMSRAMKWINQSYSLHHKRRKRRIGHLWQGRFKSININSDAQLLACGVYVDLNPVRAGLAASPGDYPWTSYRGLAGIEHDRLISPDSVWNLSGCSTQEKQVKYKELVDFWQKMPATKIKDDEHE